VSRKCAGNRWELCERRHENWLFRVIPCELLEIHHKATIAGNTSNTLRFHPLNRFNKLCLNPFGHFTALAYLEGQSWHNTIKNIVTKTVWAIDIAFRRGVIIIQSNYAQ